MISVRRPGDGRLRGLGRAKQIDLTLSDCVVLLLLGTSDRKHAGDFNIPEKKREDKKGRASKDVADFEDFLRELAGESER